MQNGIKSRAKKKRLLDLSLWLFVIGISFIFLFFVQAGLEFRIVRFMNLKTVGYLCLFFSLFFALVEDKIRYLRFTYQRWLFFLLVYFCFISILGIIYLNPLESLYFTSSDVFAMFCFSGLLVASKATNWKVLEKTLIFHFAIATILCIFYMLTHGRVLLYEEAVASPIYKFWGLLYGWPYFLLTLNSGGFSRKAIAIVGVSTFFLLSIIFLKRIPFVEGILVICIMFAANTFLLRRKTVKKARFRRILSSIGLLILLTVVILAGIKVTRLDSITEEYGTGYGMSGLYGRYMKYGSIYTTVVANYRLTHEVKTVLENDSVFEVVFGRGIGATIPVSLTHSIEGRSGELHSGLAKLFLKGGILFLVIWYLGWLFVIIDFIKYRQRWLVPCYSIIIMTVLLSPIDPFFNNSLGFALVMLCAGRCMSKHAYMGIAVNEIRTRRKLFN